MASVYGESEETGKSDAQRRRCHGLRALEIHFHEKLSFLRRPIAAQMTSALTQINFISRLTHHFGFDLLIRRRIFTCSPHSLRRTLSVALSPPPLPT